ncbi:MAG: sugar ABC transporter ATP-binding protein [Chloroflexi bacterium]|nr:MAG: sugar ABC transporter ATP-binding protein [Chloroflexota bacterium]
MATLAKASTSTVRTSSGARARRTGVKLLVFVLLLLGAFIQLLPLVYMLSTSLKQPSDVFRMPPEWIPDPIVFANYVQVWNRVDLARGFVNSMTVAVISTAGEVLVSALAGFAFARMRFPGRNAFFGLLLVTMMIPGVVTMIPSFILFRILGWIDTYRPLIVPLLFGSAFAVFLARQFFRTLPPELEDAARVDGANPFQTFLFIFLPLAAPILATLGGLGFIARWNDFLGPLIYLNTADKFTLPLMLVRLNSLYERQWHLLMAGSLIAILPIVFILIFMQKYFIESVAVTGLKG